MTESPSGDESQELDRQIAEVEASIEGMRTELRDAGALDSEERAATLTNIEELEGVLDGLRRRKESLDAS